MLRLDWFRCAQIGVMIAALGAGIGCGGGGDDGDGGSLSAREEQAVQEWFVGMAAAGQAMGDMPMPRMGQQQSDFGEFRRRLNDLIDMSPPRVSNNEANQALRDFHGGMSTMLNAMDEALEAMEDATGPADMAAAMQAMMGMEAAMQESMQRVITAGQTLRTIFEVDFGDNPEALAQIRQAFSGLDLPGPSGPNAAPAAPGGMAK